MARSARTRCHGDLDFTDGPYLHHETRWSCAVSGVSRSDRYVGVAEVDATEDWETRTDDADPSANEGRGSRRSQ